MIVKHNQKTLYTRSTPWTGPLPIAHRTETPATAT